MPIVGMEDCTVVGSDEESRRSLLDSGSSAPSSRTVVVADDDATTRILVRDALEQDGWVVEEAADGAAACDMVERLEPDVVVLDVGMPKLDGYEACARLRTMPSSRHIPVMLITGMDDEESIDHAYEVGATDFLPKPVSFVSLRRRLLFMHRAEQDRRDLRNERDFASAVVDHSAAFVMVLDPTGRIDRFNDSSQRASGYSPDGAHGQRVWDILSAPDERESERLRFERLISERGTSQYEGSWTTADGERREIAWCNSVLLNRDGQVAHVVCTGLDMTERNQAQERARFLDSYDPLTGLPNRRLVAARVDKAISDAPEDQQVGVVVLDLDRFKVVNDTLGRAGGDEVLNEVAGRLMKSLRLSGVISRRTHQAARMELGRLGADEFSTLVTCVSDASELTTIVERLQQALVRPLRIGDRELTITASAGAAVYPADGSTSEALLRNAESALEGARDQMRGAFHFYSGALRTGRSDRLSLETELGQAVRRGELVVHYQPKTFTASGRTAGAEALVRWPHPSRGLVSPASFIAVAEESGLIIPIGKEVLRQACDQVVRWLESGRKPVPVAVNLSPAQFCTTDLLEDVASVLNETTLAPRFLAIEITESTIMRDTQQARGILVALRALGVQVAIDDFGTGHSTLSSLKQLPVHQLKIDQAFIKNLAQDSRDVAITRAIIAMAHGLGLTVVAEGVESKEQLAILDKEGCDQVQGFLIGQPMPSEQFAELLEEQTPSTRGLTGTAVATSDEGQRDRL